MCVHLSLFRLSTFARTGPADYACLLEGTVVAVGTSGKETALAELNRRKHRRGTVMAASDPMKYGETCNGWLRG